MLGGAAIPCSLVATGLFFAGHTHRIAYSQASMFTFLKLVVQPLIGWATAGYFFGIEETPGHPDRALGDAAGFNLLRHRAALRCVSRRDLIYDDHLDHRIVCHAQRDTRMFWGMSPARPLEKEAAHRAH